MAKDLTIITNEFAIEGAKAGVKYTNIELGLMVRNQAVDLCPVDLGQLKNSIMVKSKDTEEGFNKAGGEAAPDSQKLTIQPKEGEAYVGTNSDHWYPEFGTRHQEAQPFMRPSIEIVRGGNASAVMKKYNSDAMRQAYSKKKVTKKDVRG